jgi:hypothetical protein
MELAWSQDGTLAKLYTWAPRLTELKLAGVIYKSDARRKFQSRGPLIVWKLEDRPTYREPEPNDQVAREREACARLADEWGSPLLGRAIRSRGCD